MIDRQPADADHAILHILSNILSGDNNRAMKTVEAYFPEPTTRVLDNTIASSTYLLSIGKSTGLIGFWHRLTSNTIGMKLPKPAWQA